MSRPKPRDFNTCPGELTVTGEEKVLQTTFFTKINTKTATVTAYYEHVTEDKAGHKPNIFAHKPQLPEPTTAPPPLPKVSFNFLDSKDQSEITYDVPSKTNVQNQ